MAIAEEKPAENTTTSSSRIPCLQAEELSAADVAKVAAAAAPREAIRPIMLAGMTVFTVHVGDVSSWAKPLFGRKALYTA